MIQAHIFYGGNVQGIGFRYTARTFANQCCVTGWVKNLKDGRVEILAESERENMNTFCQLLEEQFEGYIRDKKYKEEKAKGRFTDFQIAH